MVTEQKVNSAPPAHRERSHIPELDGIRGIAIIMVLLTHAFAISMQGENWTGVAHWVELLTRPGWAGVDLFFVLSGFLITGILLDSAGKPHYFRNFYARRALRILPLYYGFLVLIAICYSGAHDYVFLSIFYLSNTAPIFGVAVIYPPLWSLSVEEHFYLLWPWLISRLKPHRVWLLATGICVVEPLCRGLAFLEGWNVGHYSWFRFDGLAAGALLAAFFRSDGYSDKRLWSVGWICVGSAILVGAGGLPIGIYTRKTLFGAAFLYSLFDLLFVGGIAVVLSRRLSPLSSLMRFRWLQWVGMVSYFLYIAHWLIFYGWDSFIGEYPVALVAGLGKFGALCIRALGVYLVCFLLAELSHRYFEGPLLRLKRYFAYSPAARENSLARLPLPDAAPETSGAS